MDQINLQVIRESFGRVVYSHKTHEKEAEIQQLYASIVKWANIILITITSGALLNTLITDQRLYLIISTIFASITLGFVIFQLSFNSEEKAQRHKHIANLLWSIRERYVSLMADIRNETISVSQITEQRGVIMRELDLIYKSAPSTSRKAYQEARKALKVKEEFTFSDEEINQFLPKDLWFTK